MDKDETWRAKVRQLCDGLGAAGDAVYREIEDAVEARIDEVRTSAYQDGRHEEYEFMSTKLVDFED